MILSDITNNRTPVKDVICTNRFTSDVRIKEAIVMRKVAKRLEYKKEAMRI
jgi:hypothetical protein